ncbi:MAG: Gfo/Idh/MocA family oxidoreductase [Spartobacteria bacterium]
MNANDDSFDRRKFLARAARGAVALTLGPSLVRIASAQEEIAGESPAADAVAETESSPTGDRVGFALVGLGRLSIQQLIPAFRASKKAKLTALVSGDPAKAQKIAQENGVDPKSVYDYKNFGRIKDNKNVQVVYIVLPNSMHAEYTVRAARAGKHVLCEQPMEVSVTKCQQMISECRHAKVKLMVAYRIQYEPMNRAMQQLVREKTFGPMKTIESANCQMVREMEWRLSEKLSGSGAVGDVGVYCINTIRFLLGEEPIEIFAQTFRPAGDSRFKEVDATTTWQMRFPSGVLANCMCSFDAHDTKSYRVVAERGTFGMDPAFSYRGLKMFAQPNDPPLPQIGTTDQFASELDHMADCVLNDREPYTPGEEGLQDQRIIEAIFDSAKRGKPVTLPKIDKVDAFRGAPPA